MSDEQIEARLDALETRLSRVEEVNAGLHALVDGLTLAQEKQRDILVGVGKLLDHRKREKPPAHRPGWN